jgi:hypothetical protein
MTDASGLPKAEAVPFLKKRTKKLLRPRRVLPDGTATAT